VARDKTTKNRLTVETLHDKKEPPRAATMPWWLAAIGGAVVAAVCGWALVAALVLVAQLAGVGSVSAEGLILSTKVWLLAHGGQLTVGGTHVTLIPLGLTVIIAVILHGVAGYAGKQDLLAHGEVHQASATWKVAGVVAGVYAVVVQTADFLVSDGAPQPRVGLAAAVLAVVLAFFGARKAIHWDLWGRWPVWARVVPRAIGVGVLVAFIGGTIALVAGLVSKRAEFVTLTEQLNPGWAGGVVLTLVQLLFVVTLAIWCMTWTFGPGFTVGDGSVISLAGSQVGLLPAFPITAAIPTETSSANLLWLAVPVLAGAASAVMVLRARPRARFDETALVGGLVGVGAGLGVVGVSLASIGSLGTDRLAHVGPFWMPLLVIAPCIMGLGAMITGFVVGLIRRPAAATGHRWWARWSSGDESDVPSVEQTDGGSEHANPKPSEESTRVGDATAATATGTTASTAPASTPTVLDPTQPLDLADRPAPPQDVQLPLDFHPGER
jgi:hypothetical protein